MPTENRRVATYLPKELDDRLKAFIAERNLKGESQALITILSEFFDVSYPTAHKVDYSAFVTQEQFKELLAKVSELSVSVEIKSPGEVLRKLREKLDLLEKRLDDRESDKPRSEAKVESVPGQMSLLEAAKSELPENAVGELPESAESESSSSLESELVSKLQPMDEQSLADRFSRVKKTAKKTISNSRSKWRDNPQKFFEWSRESDPDKVSWRYNPEDKLYHPLP